MYQTQRTQTNEGNRYEEIWSQMQVDHVNKTSWFLKLPHQISLILNYAVMADSCQTAHHIIRSTEYQWTTSCKSSVKIPFRNNCFSRTLLEIIVNWFYPFNLHPKIVKWPNSNCIEKYNIKFWISISYQHASTAWYPK